MNLKKSTWIVLIFSVVLVVAFTVFGKIISNKFSKKDSQNNASQVIENIDENENLEEDSKNTVEEEEKILTNIKVKIGNEVLDAILYDNQTARDFLNKLPLELSMLELNNNEKYYYLDTPLTMDAQKVSHIVNGDLMLFGSSCFVMFYDSFDTEYTYTKIGKILKIAVVLALIVIFLIFCIIYFNSYGEIYLKDKEKINSLDDLIYYQSNVDKEIEEYSNSNFTIDNAKIMQNPYKIAPLTAVIIFKTNEEEMVDLSINGKKVTTFDASKKHIIPVYGLKAGFSNIVEISVDDIKKEYVITTEKYEGDDLEVIKNSDSLDSSNYLLSTNFTNNRIYDKNGNLLWYIDGNFAGDIEYVTNDIFNRLVL